jgi:RNA polymerase sigma-70 factor (ECF subfamily)
VLITDGGGKRSAALRPMVGRDDILALIRGLQWRNHWLTTPKVRLVRVNGYLGAILETDDGLISVAFQPDGAGRLAAIYMVVNPEKLGRVSAR